MEKQRKKNANKLQFRTDDFHKAKYEKMDIPIRTIAETGIDNWYNNREDMKFLARYYYLENKIQQNEDKITELKAINREYNKEYEELKIILSEIDNYTITIEMDKKEIAIKTIQKMFNNKKNLYLSNIASKEDMIIDFYKDTKEPIDTTLKNNGINTRDKEEIIKFLSRNIIIKR